MDTAPGRTRTRWITPHVVRGPLPRLVAPGLLLAVDAYAMRGTAGRRIERAPLDVPELASMPAPFCHGLRCDEFIFTSGQSALDERGEALFGGDLPSQNRHALDGVAAILDGLGAGPGDIVKFNTWRAPPPSTQAYRRAAQDRFDFLAAAQPAVTEITIPETTRPGPLIRMDAWAMRPNRGEPSPRRTLKPARHWDWPSPTPSGPASSDVPIDELAHPGMLVEIEAVAAVSPRRGIEPR